MTSWLTTHYPHPTPDTHPWHIYLQRQHKDAVNGIQVGDRVFFYEFAGQKPIKGAPKSPLGSQAIVRVAYVKGPMYRRETVIEYKDGTTGYWFWGVPTERDDTQGFVSRAGLCEILVYKPGYNLRGFEHGTGVKRLDDADAAELWRAFKAGARRLPGVAK
jgi:hypothetical protein